MATRKLDRFIRQATEEPYVIEYERERENAPEGEPATETRGIQLANPNRLKGSKYVEFTRRVTTDYDYALRVFAGDQYDELLEAFDALGIDGQGQQELIEDVLRHYGVVPGESSSSSKS